MNKHDICYGADALGVVLTATQTQEIFQIVSLIITIIATLFSLAFTTYCWYKKAKEDGKITPQEWKELGDITKEDIEILRKLKETKKK